MKLIVLNYATAEVHIYSIEKDIDAEDFIAEKGMAIEDCEWMVADELNLNYH